MVLSLNTEPQYWRGSQVFPQARESLRKGGKRIASTWYAPSNMDYINLSPGAVFSRSCNFMSPQVASLLSSNWSSLSLALRFLALSNDERCELEFWLFLLPLLLSFPPFLLLSLPFFLLILFLLHLPFQRRSHAVHGLLKQGESTEVQAAFSGREPQTWLSPDQLGPAEDSSVGGGGSPPNRVLPWTPSLGGDSRHLRQDEPGRTVSSGTDGAEWWVRIWYTRWGWAWVLQN